MNVQSPTAVKLRNIDKSSAEVSFFMFPQNVNEEGFLQRFVNEAVSITPAWMDRDGKVIDGDDGQGAILGARFKVEVAAKRPEPDPEPEVDESPSPATKKVTKKKVAAKDSE